MSDPWLPILSKLNLSRVERAAVKRYEQDPQGRSFLPIADILRSHKKIEESLELMLQGVDRHPHFVVARVVLARELLNKGIVAHAWQVLEDTPASLDENVLAQKLRFKLAILQGLETSAKDVLAHMEAHQMLSEDLRSLANALTVDGIKKTQAFLVEDFRKNDVNLIVPEIVESAVSEAPAAASSSAEEAAQPPDGEEEAPTEEAGLSAFHVVPLNEIFQGEQMQPTDTAGGIELDSTTLADIYAKQGHFHKALGIYRRLLRMTPNNEYLQRRTKELSRMEKDQRDTDLTIDPTVVDQMEAVDLIDAQSKFLAGLMDKLR